MGGLGFYWIWMNGFNGFLDFYLIYLFTNTAEVAANMAGVNPDLVSKER